MRKEVTALSQDSCQSTPRLALNCTSFVKSGQVAVDGGGLRGLSLGPLAASARWPGAFPAGCTSAGLRSGSRRSLDRRENAFGRKRDFVQPHPDGVLDSVRNRAGNTKHSALAQT